MNRSYLGYERIVLCLNSGIRKLDDGYPHKNHQALGLIVRLTILWCIQYPQTVCEPPSWIDPEERIHSPVFFGAAFYIGETASNILAPNNTNHCIDFREILDWTAANFMGEINWFLVKTDPKPIGWQEQIWQAYSLFLTCGRVRGELKHDMVHAGWLILKTVILTQNPEKW